MSARSAAGGSEGSALRCSFASEQRGEPVFATASPAVGFLLIEQPGGWGRHAFTESRLDREVGAAVAERAVRSSLRALLVRRPGRSRPGGDRLWAVVRSEPGRETTLWGSFRMAEELLELPLDGSTGTPSAAPVYLVCTHGTHDACCALRGRPIAAAFERERPGAAWECSHVGGDRFAANVVVAPHGLFYGRVREDDVLSIVTAQERGEVVPGLLRGRAALSPVVQAAQHFARNELGLAAIGDLRPVSEASQADGGSTVELVQGTSVVTVTVRQVTGELAGLLTCRATFEVHPRTFECDDIVVAGGDPLR